MSRPFKVVIGSPTGQTGEGLRRLREAGVEVIFDRRILEPPGGTYTEDELVDVSKDADALLGFGGPGTGVVTRRVLESAPRLRVVARYGIGVDRIDVSAATELGILVAMAPLHANAVAEYAVALILATAKRLQFLAAHLRRGGGRTDQTITMELEGKTLGILGLGRIGSMVAMRLGGWGLRMIAFDPYISPQTARERGADLVELETLLRESDILTLHAPLTEESRHIIGEAHLRLMKPTAIIVNTARGGLIDEEALARALREGWIAGAGLETFDKEPPPLDSPLLSMENVIATPHVAGSTPEARRRNALLAAENVLDALRGEPPQYLANPEALPRWRERVARSEREG